MKRFLLICLIMAAPMSAHARPGLDDLAFLEGHWQGGDADFLFEEIWTAPAGGVMTAMARGASGETLRVLEYIILSEEPDGRLVMRFKHYNADFSTWEEPGAAPVTLILSELEGEDALFVADPPSHGVQSIRYWRPQEDALHADIALFQDGEAGGFSLRFKRVD